MALIPDDRLYTAGWQTAGITGGIPDTSGRVVFQTITSTGDTTDRTSTINTALASCPANQVVVLGPGNFTCAGRININNESGVVLRGSGMGSTTILSTATGSWGVLVGNTSADFNGVIGVATNGDAMQGDTVIPMSDTSTFAAGNRVKIFRDNSETAAWPVIGTSAAKRQMQHQTTVVSKDVSSITIVDPLPYDFPTAANAAVRIIQDGFSYQCGIEDLKMDFSGSSVAFGLSFWNCEQCWVKNCEIAEPASYIVYFLNAIHCQIDHSYLNSIQGSGTNGAGLLMEQSSLCLIENNIIQDCQPNVEINFGCTGNVLAYNAMLESQGNISLDSNHGAHNAFNLFEGNCCPNLKPDGFFGSVSHDTAIRNRFTGADTIGGANNFPSVDLRRMTRYYNVVGNILGTSGSLIYEVTASGGTSSAVYALGYPNIGNATYTGTASPIGGDFWADWSDTADLPNGYQEYDQDVSGTLIRKGNYNTATADIPAGESTGADTVPNSYYLSTKPDWFFSLSWPPFEATNPIIDNTSSYSAIPAGYRLLNGGNDPPIDSSTLNVTNLNATTLTIG